MAQDPLSILMRENSHPLRSGHIIFAPKPYYSMSHRHRKNAGSNHGTPWDYDRHVPILLWGHQIQQAQSKSAVKVIDLTRSFADRLGLEVDPRGGKPLP